jgi:hypothetical protein
MFRAHDNSDETGRFFGEGKPLNKGGSLPAGKAEG